MLCAHNLAKRYNGRVIFEGISCEFHHGDSVVVTGPNGSGKSTLLKVLCGLINPSGGKVSWSLGGRACTPQEAMASIGYMSPEVGLYDRLTAAEHIAFFAAIRRLKRDPEWVRKVLTRVQLAEYSYMPVGQFSSGMKQRMKLACTTLHDPPVLVLDEPSTNLDRHGLELLDIIITEQKARGLVIVATNEEREVEKFGQTVLRLG